MIYTPENQEAPVEDHSLLKDIHPEAEVIRRPIWEPYSFYKRFLGISGREKVNAGFLSENKKPGTREKLAVWIRGNLFIPDARKFWIRPSVRYLAKYLLQHPVDVILSTGPPHSMHLIGKKLKEKTGIPWVADFRDPWTGIDYYDQLRLTRCSDRKHRTMERAVLKKADRVVVIGRNMAKEFRRIAGVQAEVVPNGFDEEDFEGVEGRHTDTFTILHVGAMNRDRNHEAFWKAAAAVISKHQLSPGQFRIRLIGKLDHAVIRSLEKNRLSAYTETTPYMEHNRIAEELRSASLLYLPVNNTPNAKGIATGKIFEYLAAGRPVLGVGPVDGDAADILIKTKAGTMLDFTDHEGIFNSIVKIWHTPEQGTMLDASAMNQYTRRSLTTKISNILDNCTE